MTKWIVTAKLEVEAVERVSAVSLEETLYDSEANAITACILKIKAGQKVLNKKLIKCLDRSAVLGENFTPKFLEVQKQNSFGFSQEKSLLQNLEDKREKKVVATKTRYTAKVRDTYKALWQEHKLKHWLDYDDSDNRSTNRIKEFIKLYPELHLTIFRNALLWVTSQKPWGWINEPLTLGNILSGDKAYEYHQKYLARLSVSPSLAAQDAALGSPSIVGGLSATPNLKAEIKAFANSLQKFLLETEKPGGAADRLKYKQATSKSSKREARATFSPTNPYFSASGVAFTEVARKDPESLKNLPMVIYPGCPVVLQNGSQALVVSVLDKNTVRVVQGAYRLFEAELVDKSKGGIVAYKYSLISAKREAVVYMEWCDNPYEFSADSSLIKEVSVSLIKARVSFKETQK